ncbi:MAG: hypothetical protein ACI9F1_002214 [Colwellia sp.]|jgi:hypothetical protein
MSRYSLLRLIRSLGVKLAPLIFTCSVLLILLINVLASLTEKLIDIFFHYYR